MWFYLDTRRMERNYFSPIFPADRLRESSIMAFGLLGEACAWLSPQWGRESSYFQYQPFPPIRRMKVTSSCSGELYWFQWRKHVPCLQLSRFVAQVACGCLPCVLPTSATPGCTWQFVRTQKTHFWPQNESICTKGLHENCRFCGSVSTQQ